MSGRKKRPKILIGQERSGSAREDLNFMAKLSPENQISFPEGWCDFEPESTKILTQESRRLSPQSNVWHSHKSSPKKRVLWSPSSKRNSPLEFSPPTPKTSPIFSSMIKTPERGDSPPWITRGSSSTVATRGLVNKKVVGSGKKKVRERVSPNFLSRTYDPSDSTVDLPLLPSSPLKQHPREELCPSPSCPSCFSCSFCSFSSPSASPPSPSSCSCSCSCPCSLPPSHNFNPNSGSYSAVIIQGKQQPNRRKKVSRPLSFVPNFTQNFFSHGSPPSSSPPSSPILPPLQSLPIEEGTKKSMMLIRLHFPEATQILLGCDVSMKSFLVNSSSSLSSIHSSVAVKFKISSQITTLFGFYDASKKEWLDEEDQLCSNEIQSGDPLYYLHRDFDTSLLDLEVADHFGEGGAENCEESSQEMSMLLLAKLVFSFMYHGLRDHKLIDRHVDAVVIASMSKLQREIKSESHTVPFRKMSVLFESLEKLESSRLKKCSPPIVPLSLLSRLTTPIQELESREPVWGIGMKRIVKFTATTRGKSEILEWIVAVLLRVIESVLRLFRLVGSSCTRQSCPLMDVSASVTFGWSDGPISDFPISAYDYSYLLSDSITTKLKDQSLFSQEGNLTENIMPMLHSLSNHILRVFCHIYYKHWGVFTQWKGLTSSEPPHSRHTISRPRFLTPENRLRYAASVGSILEIRAILREELVPVHLFPVAEAALYGHESVLRIFLDAGAPVNGHEDGKVPLLEACQTGDLRIVKALIQYQANVNLQDSSGRTPVYLTCRMEHFQIAEELLVSGADPDIPDRTGKTPLIATCNQRTGLSTRLLLQYGADPNLADKRGQSPLITACRFGNIPVTIHLLKHGANPDLQYKEGNPALIVALKENNLSSVSLLLHYGANPDIADRFGCTLLHWAADLGHTKVIQEAIQAGADPFEKELGGRTVLDVASVMNISNKFLETCALYTKEKENSKEGSDGLNLSGFGLKKIPKFVWNEVHLKRLDLRDNSLDSLPPQIDRLTSLESLNLSNNLLKSLPVELGQISSLTSLQVEQNPLTSFPSPDLVPRKSADILYFLRSLSKKSIPWRKVRVMVVGSEKVGKTSLVSKLASSKKAQEQFDGKGYISTEGIDIVDWKIEARPEEEWLFQIWDFGGQEVFHPTHQFFLTPRALYLIVFRLGDPGYISMIDQWVQTIRSCVDRSFQLSLMIIGTHLDCVSAIEADHIREVLTTKYIDSGRAKAIVFVSNTNNLYLSEVRSFVVSLSNVATLRVRVTGSSLYLVQQLEELQTKQNRRTMTWAEFVDLALRAGVLPSAVDPTARLLHELGVFLCFKDFVHDEHQRLIVLDPKWLVEIMSNIVNVQTQHIIKNGLLTFQQLDMIWSQYSNDLKFQLLHLLEGFGIVHIINTTQSTRLSVEHNELHTIKMKEEREAHDLIERGENTVSPAHGAHETNHEQNKVNIERDEIRDEARGLTEALTEKDEVIERKREIEIKENPKGAKEEHEGSLMVDHLNIPKKSSFFQRTRSFSEIIVIQSHPPQSPSSPPSLSLSLSPSDLALPQSLFPHTSPSTLSLAQSPSQSPSAFPTPLPSPPSPISQLSSSKDFFMGFQSPNIAVVIPCLMPDQPPNLRQLWNSDFVSSATYSSTYYRFLRFRFLPLGFMARLQTKFMVVGISSKIWKTGAFLQCGSRDSYIQQALLTFSPSSYTLVVLVRCLSWDQTPPIRQLTLLTDISQSIQFVVDEFYSFMSDEIEQYVPCRHCLADITGATQWSDVDILVGVSEAPSFPNQKSPNEGQGLIFRIWSTRTKPQATFLPQNHGIFIGFHVILYSFLQCRNSFHGGQMFLECPNGNVSVKLSYLAPDLSLAEIPRIQVEVKEKLGEGGQAVVYRGLVTCKRLEEKEFDVAVKLIRGRENQPLMEPFLQEIYIMSLYQHPNLIQMFGCCFQPGLGIVVEYIRDVDLQTLLEKHAVVSLTQDIPHPELKGVQLAKDGAKCLLLEDTDPAVIEVEGGIFQVPRESLKLLRKPLPDEEISWRFRVRIAIDIASGMSYLHSRMPPIVHRDLRSPNIFLVSRDPDADIVAKVADFGLATLNYHRLNKRLLTWQWVAPEILSRRKVGYDERSDIYSFGIVLFEIATRKFPFLDDHGHRFKKKFGVDRISFIQAIIKDHLRPIFSAEAPLHCPSSDSWSLYCSLATRCWDPSPENRPTWKEILSTLKEIFSKEPGEQLREVQIDRSTVKLLEALSITRPTVSPLRDWNFQKTKNFLLESRPLAMCLVSITPNIKSNEQDPRPPNLPVASPKGEAKTKITTPTRRQSPLRAAETVPPFSLPPASLAKRSESPDQHRGTILSSQRFRTNIGPTEIWVALEDRISILDPNTFELCHEILLPSLLEGQPAAFLSFQDGEGRTLVGVFSRKNRIRVYDVLERSSVTSLPPLHPSTAITTSVLDLHDLMQLWVGDSTGCVGILSYIPRGLQYLRKLSISHSVETMCCVDQSVWLAGEGVISVVDPEKLTTIRMWYAHGGRKSIPNLFYIKSCAQVWSVDVDGQASVWSSATCELFDVFSLVPTCSCFSSTCSICSSEVSSLTSLSPKSPEPQPVISPPFRPFHSPIQTPSPPVQNLPPASLSPKTSPKALPPFHDQLSFAPPPRSLGISFTCVQCSRSYLEKNDATHGHEEQGESAALLIVTPNCLSVWDTHRREVVKRFGSVGPLESVIVDWDKRFDQPSNLFLWGPHSCFRLTS